MDNKLLAQIANNLGFSEKKSKVFLALLQLGETSVLEIAHKSQLKRTTVYNILPDLIDDGLVATTKTGKHKRYFVTDTRIVLKILERKVEDTKALLPALSALHILSTHQPKISIYEGENGARQIYEGTLSLRPGDTIFGFIGNVKTNEVPSKELKEYVQNRVTKKIQNKVIMSPSPYAELLKENEQMELRTVKTFANLSDYEMPAVDIKIYGNKVALISYRENFLGIVIESPDISKMLKGMFMAIWPLI